MSAPSEVNPTEEGEAFTLDEAFEESGEKPPTAKKQPGRTQPKEDEPIDGEVVEVDEKKISTHVIDIANEKDIKTVQRALDPEGKPLTPRRLKIAHNAFNRILKSMTDTHTKPSNSRLH